jgi:hypothetical protein
MTINSKLFNLEGVIIPATDMQLLFILTFVVL